MSRLIAVLEEVVTRDEVRRGIRPLVVDGDLEAAGRAFVRSVSVAVLTGFPCVMKHDPPTETDGICGALAIARAACLSGKSAVVLTDDCNAAVVRAAVAAANGRLAPPLLPAGATATCAAAAAAGAAPPPCAMIRVESFPAGGACDERHRARMHAAARGADLLVAVERVSRASDGDCYTMRGLSMAHLAAPLDDLFIAAPGRGAATIGIGDGGNELGMGKVAAAVRAHIPNGEKIASATAADHVITASTSDWGAYALVAAASALLQVGGDASKRDLAALMMPSDDDVGAVIAAAVAAGARDGISGENVATVDSLPMSDSYRVLRELRGALATRI